MQKWEEKKTLKPPVGHHSLNEQSNDNGLLLPNLAAANNLIVILTRLPHKNIYKETSVSNDGETRNQMDHVQQAHDIQETFQR